MDARFKLERLKDNLRRLESIAVAFSGGVDSTFLLKVSQEVLGEKVVAVTARSSSYPERELNEAIAFTKAIGVKHDIIESEELDIAGFSDNPINRCYLCKRELFSKIIAVAGQQGFKHVVEGSNTDDLNDYRPGLTAIRELKIVSPLKEASLGKDEVRMLSREMGLPTWDKPAYACSFFAVPLWTEDNEREAQGRGRRGTVPDGLGIQAGAGTPSREHHPDRGCREGARPFFRYGSDGQG